MSDANRTTTDCARGGILGAKEQAVYGAGKETLEAAGLENPVCFTAVAAGVADICIGGCGVDGMNAILVQLVPKRKKYEYFMEGNLEVILWTHKLVTIRIEWNGILCTLKYKGQVFGTASPALVRKWINRCLEEI